MTVGEIGTRAVITADPEETLIEAARRMRDRHVGALVVVDGAGRPVGILTDRDIVVSAVAQSADRIEALRVADVMSRDVVTALSLEDAADALKRMRSLGIRRLPLVSGDGRLTSIVTFDDLLNHLVGEMRDMTALVGAERRRELADRR